MRTVTRHDLTKYIFRHKRGTTYVVDTQLHISPLMVGIIQARYHMRDAKQTATHFSYH